jgi:C-terminal processing protease CtpA/Prc
MTLRIVLAACAFVLANAAGELPAQEKEGNGSKPTEVRSGRRGWLGVSVQDVTPRLARERDLTVSAGALVVDVIEDGPADKAGVKEGDVITKLGGAAIADADDLTDAVRAADPESHVSVEIRRGKESRTLAVTLGKAAGKSFSFSLPRVRPPHVFIPRIPHIPQFHVYTSHDVLGLRLSRLNKQLGEYFEAPNGKGVLVEEVEEESAGASAGFKAGDVIIRVGKEPVEDTRDLEEALDDVHKGDNMTISILRKGTPKELTVQSDDLKRSRSYWFRSEDDLDDDDAAVLGIHKQQFKHQMEHLKQELQSLGRHLREKIEEMRQTVRKEFRTVVS